MRWYIVTGKIIMQIFCWTNWWFKGLIHIVDRKVSLAANIWVINGKKRAGRWAHFFPTMSLVRIGQWILQNWTLFASMRKKNCTNIIAIIPAGIYNVLRRYRKLFNFPFVEFKVAFSWKKENNSAYRFRYVDEIINWIYRRDGISSDVGTT